MIFLFYNKFKFILIKCNRLNSKSSFTNINDLSHKAKFFTAPFFLFEHETYQTVLNGFLLINNNCMLS